MSSASSSLSPGDRAIVRRSAIADIEPGTVVWVKRMAGGEVEADTQEAVPRTLSIAVAALAAFPVAGESPGEQPRDRRRPSLLVQVLRPIAVFVALYFLWQSMDRWPRFEEPRALPSPSVQQPAMPREGR